MDLKQTAANLRAAANCLDAGRDLVLEPEAGHTIESAMAALRLANGCDYVAVTVDVSMTWDGGMKYEYRLWDGHAAKAHTAPTIGEALALALAAYREPAASSV